MATIDNLSIQLNANAEAAIAAINRTASSAERLRGAVQGAAGGMQSAAHGAQDMGSSTAQAGEQTEKTRKSLHGFWNALKQSGSYMGGAFLGGMKGIVGALWSMASGLLRIAKFRIYRTIVKDLGQSFKDLYGWSKMFGSEYANSMDRINSSFLYLRNSIASAAAPLFNALAPVLDAIIDKIVMLLNWLNQLFSALSGASTYTVARKVEQSWGDTFKDTSKEAKEATEEIKRTIMGFDEINKLQKKNIAGHDASGSSPYTSGYQYMFEEKELAGGWKDFATAIENAMSDAFSRITMIVGGAELALGAILALSGANVPLGLGLMATGAVTLGSAIFANWEGISKEVKLAVAGVEAAVAGGLAVGAVLAFSGGHVGLGIGLMIAALSTGMSAATIAWNTIGDKMSEKVQAIATLVGGASFGIGAVLAFTGHPGIGIAMMIAGASVTAVSINWNYLKENLEGPIGAVTAMIGAASLALGILALLGGNIPIGLGLILAGTAGLAPTVAANWDNLVNIGKTAIEKVKEGMTAAVGGIANFIKEHIINPIIKAWNWLLGLFGGGDDEGVTANASVNVVSNASGVADGIAEEVADKETIQKLKEIGGTMGDAIKTGMMDRLKNVSDDMWGAIIGGWNTETHELPVTVKFGESGSVNVPSSVDVGVNLVKTWTGTAMEALGLNNLVTSATVQLGTNVTADEMFALLKSAWDKTTRSLTLTLGTNVTADGLFGLFEKAWGTRTLTLTLGTNVAADKLFELIEKAWGTRTLTLTLGTNVTADKLFESLQTAWNRTAKVLNVTLGTNVTADGLFGLLQTAWGTRTLNVNIEYVEPTNDFGGATGGGGATAGGGAGRFNVPVSFSAPTPEEASNLFGRLKEAWDAGVVAVDKGLNVVVRPVAKKAGDLLSSYYGKIGEWLFGTGESPETSVTVNGNTGTGPGPLWNALTGNGETDVVVDAYGNMMFVPKSGNGITVNENEELSLTKPIGAKLQAQNTPTDVFGGGANNPLSFFGSLIKKDKNNTAKKLFGGGSTMNYYGTLKKKAAKYAPGKVFANNSLFKYFGLLVKQNAAQTASGMFDGGSTLSYYADLIQNWTGTALEALGLSNLETKIKVGLQVDSKASKVKVVPSGGKGDEFKLTQSTKKRGGIFSNGSWKDIPQYANGTTNAHGSMFLAGEAGPELVGHLGGRTEVLNQSQLAATMFSAVRAAMGGVKIAATMYSGGTGSDESDYETMYRAMYDAFTDAMSGSEQRDREKVALMREIAAKEFTAEVSAQSVNRANTRLNRRAGMTIVPVGT